MVCLDGSGGREAPAGAATALRRGGRGVVAGWLEVLSSTKTGSKASAPKGTQSKVMASAPKGTQKPELYQHLT